MELLSIKLSIKGNEEDGDKSYAIKFVTLKQKLVWPFKAEEVARIVLAIDRHKSLLTLALVAENGWVDFQMYVNIG
jgi:hypothetical protein